MALPRARSTLSLALLAVLGIGVAPPASSQLNVADPPAPPANSTSPRVARLSQQNLAEGRPELLPLEVTINGERLDGIVRAEHWPRIGLLLPAEAWVQARLAPLAQSHPLTDGTPGYALDAVAGLTYRVNRQALSVDINAPPNGFLGSTVEVEGAVAKPPPRPSPGLVLNYDLAVTDSAGTSLTGGALFEAVAFGRFGNLVASGLVRDDGIRRTAERLDTYWRYDLPHKLQTIVVGDTVGTGGGWSRPVRYAGVRWGRDFGLRPGFVTVPQLTLTGQAALPSTIELMINNVERLRQPLAPGPFTLTNVPVVTGAGQVNLVVRDLLGRETVIQQHYYASPRLLAPGLTDFSLEAGWLRTGYGMDSRYADRFAAATLRRGLTPAFTTEGRIELQAARRAAGLEISSLLGHIAIGRAALALSGGRTQGFEERGHLLRVGVERTTPTGGGTLQYEYQSRGFSPFGEVASPAAAGLRARQRLAASVGLRLFGSAGMGANYVQQTLWKGERLKSVGLSASMQVWRRISLGLQFSKRLDQDKSWQGGLTLNLPLDNGIYTSARTEAAPGQLAASLAAARNAPAGPGLGWRVEGSTLKSQRARAGLQYNTNHGEWALDLASSAQGEIAGRINSRGSIGMMAGIPFASRPMGQGSFAIVKVPGLEGVPVKHSNQLVAITDAQGIAFVPGMQPWIPNRIEIDPSELPLDMDLGEVVRQVTPYAGSGVVVEFNVKRTRQALLDVRQPNGEPVPVGARVRLPPDGRQFIVGRRGQVWLTDLRPGSQRLVVTWGGGACALVLEVPGASPGGTIDTIGPLICKQESP